MRLLVQDLQIFGHAISLPATSDTAIERFAQNMPPSARVDRVTLINKPKKKCTVHCQNAPNPLLQPNPRYPYESPAAWYIDRPWHRPLRGPADHAKSSWNFASREGLELEPPGPWGCARAERADGRAVEKNREMI